MKKEGTTERIEAIVPMVEQPRYVVARSSGGVVSVWNVLQSRCAGSAVVVQRGLADPSDVTLLSNSRVIILTDRGFSGLGKEEQPMFRTIRIFDLTQKKFVVQINDCYVIPSPAHEYVLLDEKQLLGLSENRSHFVVWSLETGLVTRRIRPAFKKSDAAFLDTLEARQRKSAITWQDFTSRDQKHRVETEEDKQRAQGLMQEKENNIERYLISKDLKVIVASYYAHHLCVFDMESGTHVQTLESSSSLMLLHVAAVTPSGSHLVHFNYDDDKKSSYVSLWECGSGVIKRRLRNEKDVCAIAVADHAENIVFGKANQELCIWQPNNSSSLKKIKGHSCLNFGVDSRIYIADNGDQAIVHAGDISVWDIHKAALLAAFSLDMKVSCVTPALGGRLILFGLGDSADVVSLRLATGESGGMEKIGQNMFGKRETSDEEEEDSDEE